ncbi:MAG: GNAT family N-acetyltransferase [Phycisphaerales bacterium]|nr:GNAT family N-acetyltransferase [Phycisphaerales bacterium]
MPISHHDSVEGIVIRETAAGDLPAILGIINREILEGSAHFGLVPVTPDELHADWSQTRERYAWFSAIASGRVVGYARGGPWKTRGAYAWACEIGIYVAPACQARGIGRSLYGALFPELRRRGLRTVIAGITLPNEASVRLHESMGMRPVGVFEAVGFKNGAWRDVGYWSLHWDADQPPSPR